MKCYNCGKIGHSQFACPEEVTCHKCKKKGHISSNCPNQSNKKESHISNGNNKNGGMNNEMKCYNCGKIGHSQYACPEGVICHKCNKKGHISSNCPNQSNRNEFHINNDNNQKEEDNGKDNSLKCFFCGEVGHKKFNCPNKKGKCYNCGKSGHRSANCPVKDKSKKDSNKEEDQKEKNNNDDNKVSDDEETNKINCPICFSNSSNGKKFQVSKCGHIICKECWNSIFLKKDNKCPLCKKNLNKNDLTDIFI